MVHYVENLSDEQMNAYERILEELRQTKEWRTYQELNSSNDELLKQSIDMDIMVQELHKKEENKQAAEVFKRVKEIREKRKQQVEKNRKLFDEIFKKFEKKAKDIPDFYQERINPSGKNDKNFVPMYVENALLMNLAEGEDFREQYNQGATGFNNFYKLSEENPVYTPKQEQKADSTKPKEEVTERKGHVNKEIEDVYQRLFSTYGHHLQSEKEGRASASIYPEEKERIFNHLSDRELEELNSYANLKAIESLKNGEQKYTDEAVFADHIASSIKTYCEKEPERQVKVYRWKNEDQRAKDDEIERQKEEARWREEQAERERKEAAWKERQKREAEKQKEEAVSHDVEHPVGKPANETAGTESKDFDFDAFLAEVGKSNPNESIIRAGVEKFGTGKLTDEQHEKFLKTIFPEENKSISLGFKNMKAINNVMVAVVELSQSGELTPEQVKNLLLTQNPNGNGMNIVSTIALNIRAGEFKLENMQDNTAKVSLRENLVDADTALAYLGQLDEDIVKEIINTPDNSEKAWSIESLAASNNSKILSKFLENPKGYLDNGYLDAIYPDYNAKSDNNSDESAIEVDTENKTVVGGDNTLNIDGVKKPSLNVNTPKNNIDDDEELVGDVDPQSAKDGKRRDFDFDKVKEQDIIQYMYEHWFLEGLSIALKAPFWLANKCLDTLDNKFDSSVPKASLKPGEVEGNYNAIDFLNEQGAKIASACMGGIENQKDYYDALYKTIKNNAGKDIDKWKVEKFNGKPVLDITKEFDRMKIQGFNDELSRSSSATDFENKLNTLKEITEEDFKTINVYMQIGARLAVSQYMAKNQNGPFDDSSKEKIMKAALANTNSILQTIKSINERMEYNYRMEHGIDAKTPLDDTQKAELEKATGPVMEKFMTDLTNRGADLRTSVYQYNKRNNKAEKDKYAKIMQTNLHSLNNILDIGSGLYLDEICPSRLGKRSPEKISIFDLTKQETESVKLQGLLNSVSQRIEDIEARKQELLKIKQSYKEHYPAFRRFTNKLSGMGGKAGREFDEVKEDVKEFGRDVKDKGKEVGKEVKKDVKNMKDSIFGREI